MSSSKDEVLLKVKIPDGRVYEDRRIKADIEIGDILNKLQEICALSSDTAKYFSLYTVENASFGKDLIPQKIFVDQRTSSRKLFHHFGSKDTIWDLHYGIKYYPVSPLDDDWTSDTLKLLHLYQIHEDIENGVISLKYTLMDEIKKLIILFYKASGKNMGQSFVFHKNLVCKDLMTQLMMSGCGDFTDLDESQSYGEWFKLVFQLPGYGMHPFVGYIHKSVQRKYVLLSCNNKGIYIRNFDDLNIQDLFLWENIHKVSYISTKLVIKHMYPSDKGKKKHVFYMDQKKYAKNMWKNVIDHHGFFRLKKYEFSPLPLQTLLERKSNYRHFLINSEQQGSYVIGKKNDHLWGITELPNIGDDASLLYQVEIKLCYLPKYDEYSYRIIEDTSRHHCLHETVDKVHLCMEACYLP